MERSTIRILLVDDFEPYRDFTASLLEGNPEIQIIAAVSNGVEAVTSATELVPDVVLIDIGLPELDGLEAARRIRKLAPSSKIVFLTQETSAEVVKEALSLGGWGYIVKQQARTDLLAALEAILQGKRFFSKGLDLDGLAREKDPDGAN